MARAFDAGTLEMLRATDEIRIRTRKHKGHGVTIWSVTVGDQAFIRSFRGAQAKWYVDAVADRQATLEVGDRQVAVRLLPVTDPDTVEAVSQAYLSKYASSPYAKAMVAPEVLSTTLRVDPM
jgi:hypothetical protein